MQWTGWFSREGRVNITQSLKSRLDCRLVLEQVVSNIPLRREREREREGGRERERETDTCVSM